MQRQSAKRLCLAPRTYVLQQQKACLRIRPSYGSKPEHDETLGGGSGRPSSKGSDWANASRTHQDDYVREAPPDDLHGAEEGKINFERAEAELKRRIKLVGWQLRKGNAYVDRTTVVCRGGKGGDGAVSFMRYPFAPDNTPPDGAGGGRGGNVYVRVTDAYQGLGHLPHVANAGVGVRGMGDHRTGTRGRDIILEVPPGTLVKERRLPEEWPPPDLDGEEPPLDSAWQDYVQWENARRDRIFTYYPGLQGEERTAAPEDERFFRAEAEILMHERLLRRQELLREPLEVDLVEMTEDPLLVAVGGDGGKGNHSFVGGYCRLPKFGTRGMEGQRIVLDFELKSLADVGLVGFPNAGKSTLLRAMSESKAEIAPYPFTTLRPHLGTVIMYDDGSFGEQRSDAILDSPAHSHRHGPYSSPTQVEPQWQAAGASPKASESFRMLIADCPGILPDASKNVGLGHDFLRHVERSPALAYVVDLSSEDPAQTLKCLRDELEQYKPGLSERARVIIANKADRLASESEARSRIAALAAALSTVPILPCSGRHRHNIARLVRILRSHVEAARAEANEHEPRRRAEREAKLELEIDRTVKRIGIFRRAGGIDFLQHATPSDRQAAQRLYDNSFKQAKIEDARWWAEQSARRAVRAENESERKRLEWDERRRRREGLADADTEHEHDQAAHEWARQQREQEQHRA